MKYQDCFHRQIFCAKKIIIKNTYTCNFILHVLLSQTFTFSQEVFWNPKKRAWDVLCSSDQTIYPQCLIKFSWQKQTRQMKFQSQPHICLTTLLSISLAPTVHARSARAHLPIEIHTHTQQKRELHECLDMLIVNYRQSFHCNLITLFNSELRVGFSEKAKSRREVYMREREINRRGKKVIRVPGYLAIAYPSPPKIYTDPITFCFHLCG